MKAAETKAKKQEKEILEKEAQLELRREKVVKS